MQEEDDSIGEVFACSSANCLRRKKYLTQVRNCRLQRRRLLFESGTNAAGKRCMASRPVVGFVHVGRILAVPHLGELYLHDEVQWSLGTCLKRKEVCVSLGSIDGSNRRLVVAVSPTHASLSLPASSHDITKMTFTPPSSYIRQGGSCKHRAVKSRTFSGKAVGDVQNHVV